MLSQITGLRFSTVVKASIVWVVITLETTFGPKNNHNVTSETYAAPDDITQNIDTQAATYRHV